MNKQTISTLQKIQSMVANVRDGLAALKPSNNMEDLDQIAQQRAVLREKLEMLTEAEQAELHRLEAQEQETINKKHRAILLDFAKKVETAAERHKDLTNQANDLLGELAVVLVQRERIGSNLGLGALQSLPKEHVAEITSLAYVWDNLRLSPHGLGNAWRHAISQRCTDMEQVKFSNLIQSGGPIDGQPFQHVSNAMAEKAKAIAQRI